MSKVDSILKQIAMEKRLLGDIIEYRSRYDIPFDEFTEEQKELEDIEKLLKAYKRNKTVGLKEVK